MPVRYDEITNEDLHAMCLAGEEDAWAHVYGFALSITRQSRWRLGDAAEDVAQQAVLHLLDGAVSKVNKPGSFRAFVRRITVHKIIELLRSKDHKLMISGDTPRPGERESRMPEPVCPRPSPEDCAAGTALAEAVSRALMDLPDYCREIVPQYIRYLLGYFKDYKELSAGLGRTVGAVSGHVRHCLDRIAAHPLLQGWLPENRS